MGVCGQLGIRRRASKHSSAPLVLTSESRSEPPNKNCERQRRFLSLKRQRQKPNKTALAKPTRQERMDIESNLLKDKLIAGTDENDINLDELLEGIVAH